jgi:hypothetical protein
LKHKAEFAERWYLHKFSAEWARRQNHGAMDAFKGGYGHSGGIFKMSCASSGHQKHLLPTPLALFLKKDGPQTLEIAA